MEAILYRIHQSSSTAVETKLERGLHEAGATDKRISFVRLVVSVYIALSEKD